MLALIDQMQRYLVQCLILLPLALLVLACYGAAYGLRQLAKGLDVVADCCARVLISLNKTWGVPTDSEKEG